MNLLIWLQHWYAQQCNGLWEHVEGVKIETLDNPGWHVGISIKDTDYESKDFKAFRDYRTDDNWIACKVQDGKFNGAGGPLNLQEILKIFQDWILS